MTGSGLIQRVTATVAAVAVATTVAACLLPGAPPISAAADEGPATQKAICRLLVTGDTRGNLEPCGCEKGQFGGLPRRATFLAKTRKPEGLLLDLGNVGAGTSGLDRIGWRVMLHALDDLGYDAVVPGASEISDLAEFEVQTKAFVRTKVICANLVRQSDDRPVFDRWLLRDLPDRTRVAVVGLTSDAQTPPEGFRILPLKETVAAALEALKDRAERVIVAGWIEGRPALELAAAFPQLAVVVGGNVASGSPELMRREGAPCMLAGERGQYVAEVGFGLRATAVKGKLNWLGADTIDDEAMAAVVQKWKQALQSEGDAAVAATLVALRGQGRAGSSSCGQCHANEQAAWTSSKHAHAMRSLAEKREDRNPTCVHCHFEDVTAATTVNRVEPDSGIGCESCHGNAGLHVAAKRRGDAPSPMTRMGAIGASSCVRCHDVEHSSKFKFDEYWPKIGHGNWKEPSK